MSGTVVSIIFIVILIMLSGFFSSAETSLTTVNHIRVKTLAEEGNKRAATLLKVITNPSKMLSAILIGNNIVNMAVSALTTTVTIQLFGNAFVGLATGILTLVILLFGEITPKTLANMQSEKFALSYAPVIYWLMILLTPVIYIVNLLEKQVMKVLHVDPNAKAAPMTEGELRTLVGVGQEDGAIKVGAKQMIYNVFDFGDSCTADVMIPRVDMILVDSRSSRDELQEIFRKYRHTRFPVYEDTKDNVIGIINMKDLLLDPEPDTFSIKDILREPYYTYEHKPTADLLVEMRHESVNMAIVLDEYGATSGLVTLEDLLEEIVGDIRDEYDDEAQDLICIVPGKEYVASGSAKIDDINEELGLSLHTEEYGSLGGFIIEHLDSLPEEGQDVCLEDGTRLVVEEITSNRVRKIHIYLTSNTES